VSDAHPARLCNSSRELAVNTGRLLSRQEQNGSDQPRPVTGCANSHALSIPNAVLAIVTWLGVTARMRQ